MRNRWIEWTTVGGLVLAASWQAGASGSDGFEDALSRESYGMGALIGDQLRGHVIDVDRVAFLQGLGDALQDRELALGPEEVWETAG